MSERSSWRCPGSPVCQRPRPPALPPPCLCWRAFPRPSGAAACVCACLRAFACVCERLRLFALQLTRVRVHGLQDGARVAAAGTRRARSAPWPVCDAGCAG